MLTMFPQGLNDWRLRQTQADRNASLTQQTLTIEDVFYALAAVEKKVGNDGSTDPVSLDYRVATVESRVTTIETEIPILAAKVNVGLNQVGIGTVDHGVAGSDSVMWTGDKFTIAPVFPSGGNKIGLLVNASGSTSLTNMLIDLQWASATAFKVSRTGNVTTNGNLTWAQAVGAWPQFLSSNGSGGLLNPGVSRTQGTIYITDIQAGEATTPHGLLVVHRTGPSAYDAADDIGAIMGFIDTDASKSPQAGTVYGAKTYVAIGGTTSGSNVPALAQGITAGVDLYATGTLPTAVAIDGKVQILAGNSSSIITDAMGLRVKVFTKTNGTITNAWGVYLEDQTVGGTENAAVRLGTEGKISWNNDLFLKRTGAGIAELGGTFTVSVGTPSSTPIEVLKVKASGSGPPQRRTFVSKITTTDGTANVTAASFATSSSIIYGLSASICGRRVNGAAVGVTALLAGHFLNASGTLTQTGATAVIHYQEDDAAFDANLTVSGTNILVRVTGKASFTMDWEVILDIWEV